VISKRIDYGAVHYVYATDERYQRLFSMTFWHGGKLIGPLSLVLAAKPVKQ
jgi:hypothetical protein